MTSDERNNHITMWKFNTTVEPMTVGAHFGIWDATRVVMSTSRPVDSRYLVSGDVRRSKPDHMKEDTADTSQSNLSSEHRSQKEPEPQPEPKPEPQPEPQPEGGTQSEKALEPPSSHRIDSSPETVDDDIGLITINDYDENEASKPDVVDDDVIQQLVDRFLNTGSTDDEGSTATKSNQAAQALVNTSSYWSLENVEPEGSIKDPAQAKMWLDGYVIEAQKVLFQVAKAGWNYFTSVSNLNKQILSEAEEVLGLFVKSSSAQAKQFDIGTIEDPSLRRQLEILSIEGMNALNAADYSNYTNAQSEISSVISESTICDSENATPCLYRLSDIPSLLAHERDPMKVLHIWKAWRAAIGPKLIDTYATLTDLTNKGAKLNGFPDGGAMWRSPFDLSSRSSAPKLDIVAEVDRLYHQILPFYRQLHAYIRRQLAGIYRNAANSGITKDGSIPEHLLRSISGESWISYYPETKPFPQNNSLLELQENLQKKNFTSKAIFVQAYKYFKHIGFEKLPLSFWKGSVFARSWSKDVLCQPASAYDLRDGENYRVKACAQVTESDFRLAHKLLAQVYYQYLYRHQPLPFRETASPSLSEAITNVFSIVSVNTDYLKSLTLIDGRSSGQSYQINKLYLEALEEIIKLPFDIVVDKWRFNIFEGKTNKSKWNTDWWKLSEAYRGVKPPVPRSNNDFDSIAAKAIAQTNSPALRHFIGYVTQFQILKAVCPHQPHLSEGCVLNKASVENIQSVMKLGSSITWIDALRMITGSDRLDAKPLLEYYAPLINWLENINERSQVVLGWDGVGTSFTESELPQTQSNGTESELHLVLSEDQVAYPGGDCSMGQECLLDSSCTNGICECSEGLYTLRIANTVNCVPGNPADAGFGDGRGGLVIGLFPSEHLSTSETDPGPEPSPQPNLNDDSDTSTPVSGVVGRFMGFTPVVIFFSSFLPLLCVML